MTLQTVLIWSVCRSLIITSIALPVSLSVWRLIQATSGSSRFGNIRTWLLIGSLLPLFVPDLLTGFSYRLTAARLIHSSLATEGLYAALVLFRIVALQTVVRLVLPATAMSPESLHSWKLLPSRNLAWRMTWVRIRLMGPYRAAIVAFIAGALWCFQEFETAALLQVDRHPIAFTVWLFDAHAAGETLTRSLRFVAGSVIFQLTLLLPLISLLSVPGRKSEAGRGPFMSERNHRNASKTPPIVAITVALVFVLFWPVASNGTGLFSGLAGLLSQGTMNGRVWQILVSLSAAATSALLAMFVAVQLRRTESSLLTTIAVIPGLCGALVLSILLLAVFQIPVVNAVYDSWIPMIVGTTLLMLPRALVLVFVLEVTSSGSTRHSAHLLKFGDSIHIHTGQQLLWHLVWSRWLLALTVLTHWSFWDVTVASILRPVHFEPVVTRLYNEMHYGRTESLVAITFLALLIPFVAMLLIVLILKLTPYMKKVAS